jgi:hypothetical protein
MRLRRTDHVDVGRGQGELEVNVVSSVRRYKPTNGGGDHGQELVRRRKKKVATPDVRSGIRRGVSAKGFL